MPYRYIKSSIKLFMLYIYSIECNSNANTKHDYCVSMSFTQLIVNDVLIINCIDMKIKHNYIGRNIAYLTIPRRFSFHKQLNWMLYILTISEWAKAIKNVFVKNKCYSSINDFRAFTKLLPTEKEFNHSLKFFKI